MSELKPCPACGGVAEMKRQGNDYTKKRRIVVRCPACRLERADAAIHHSMEWLEGVATKNWNTRPIEDALRAEVAKYRGMEVEDAALRNDNEALRAEVAALKDEIEKHANRGEDMNDNFRDYDAGLLNDFGGGNVGWWQDYLRAEIGRANDHWRQQVDGLTAERDRFREMFKAAKLSVCDLEAKLDKHTEPLTDEQAERAFAIAKENGVGECDTLAHGVQGIDAAIRRVRRGE